MHQLTGTGARQASSAHNLGIRELPVYDIYYLKLLDLMNTAAHNAGSNGSVLEENSRKESSYNGRKARWKESGHGCGGMFVGHCGLRNLSRIGPKRSPRRQLRPMVRLELWALRLRML